MKRQIFFFLLIALIKFSGAQYCSSSDTAQCITTSVPADPGLYPKPDSFPPVYNHILVSDVIYFRNFDSIYFGNQVLRVYSLKWDTIENLPPGLCWSTNKSNNTYAPGEAGCIHIRGLPCGATGQYKLNTLVTVDIGIPIESDGDPGGLGYFMRLENPGDATMAPDTSQSDAVPLIPYGSYCQNLQPLIVDIGTAQNVCAGSIITFNPLVSGGQSPYTYLWSDPVNNVLCTACANAVVTATQSSTVYVTVTDASGNYGTDSVVITAVGTPYNFQISAPAPYTFCAGGSVLLNAASNSAITYQWYNNNGIISGSTSNTLLVTDVSGAYYISYTEPGVCQATSNIINLHFYDTTNVSITSLASDTICAGGAVTLVANALGTQLTFNWFMNDSSINYTDNTYNAYIAGTYQVAVTNLSGCTDTSGAVVIVASPNLPPAVSYGQFISDTICNNSSSITLGGGLPDGGYYSGDAVVSGSFEPSLAAGGLNFVYYTYTDNTGCSNTVSDSIDVLICTGISSSPANSYFDLYPNPCNDELSIALVSAESIEGVFVYSIDGSLVKSFPYPLGASKCTVSTASLASGYYLICLKGSDKSLIQRFLKIE